MKRIVLVTGPPGNGRDEYIKRVLPELEKSGKVGYHHVFEYMQKIAPYHKVPHLSRENIFDLAKATLDQIRDEAYRKINDSIQGSSNEIEIVSTPATFRIKPWGPYLTDRVDGITLTHLTQLKPTNTVVIIDDLLRVRENMQVDPRWRKMELGLKELAEWRNSAIEIVEDYSHTNPPYDWIIFPKEHEIKTFVDLVLEKKPRVYMSYAITGKEDFAAIERFANKLSQEFVCIDPGTIYDWDIVRAYDDAVEKSATGNISITTKYRSGAKTFSNVPLNEVEDAIDLIRTQIVTRDYFLIGSVHATVVYHRDRTPSYGVMCEVIHSANVVSRPVYVLYPHKTRLSPFFEHFVKKENLVSGDLPPETLEEKIIQKMKDDSPSWLTIPTCHHT